MAPYSFDAPADGLRRRATSGVLKTGLSQVVRLLVQFGSIILLSRLLVPGEFGLVAMAAPILALALLFQDLGFTQAVVQKPSLSQGEVSALFGVSIAVSLMLALLLLLSAPLVDWFYGEPRVGTLTAAMGVNILLAGAGSIHYALLNRRMQFGVLAVIDASAALGNLLASAILAMMYHSFWALYAGAVVQAFILTTGSWLAAGWRPSLPGRRSGAGSALRFGANVTGFNLANFFARNLDNVLIGQRWGEGPLGLYDRAYKLLLLPLQQINAPIAKIMLPVLSRMTEEPERYRRAFLRTVSQTLTLTLPGVAFLVGTSDLLIPFIRGEQWRAAAPIFAALGTASFLQVLNNPTGWLFMSQNRTREYMYWGIFGSLTSILGFLLGLPYGALGVAVAYAAGEYLRTPILWWYVTRTGPLRARDVAREALPHYAGALVALAAVLVMRGFWPPVPLVVLGGSLVLSFVVSLTVMAAFSRGRETIRESLDLIRRLSVRHSAASS